MFGLILGGPVGWLAFLIASYVLGHFIFIVGSFLLDGIYDYSYKEWFGKDASTQLQKL